MKPKRKGWPVALVRLLHHRCNNRCEACGVDLNVVKFNYDHRPPLEFRAVADDGKDWVPAQHDPKWLDVLCKPCHDLRTFKGVGAQLSDIAIIAKFRRSEKKRNGKEKRKATIQGRSFAAASGGVGKGRKLQGRGFRKRPDARRRRERFKVLDDQ